MPYLDQANRQDYARNWNKQRREAFFLLRVCEQCGGTEHLCIVPNIRPDKISWSMGEATIAAKMVGRKIQCWGCKSRAQAAAKGQSIRHGTLWCYKQGCRCEACLEAKAGEWERRRSAQQRRRKAARGITQDIPFLATEEELDGLLREGFDLKMHHTGVCESGEGGSAQQSELIGRKVLPPAREASNRVSAQVDATKRTLAAAGNSVTWSDELNCLLVDGKVPQMPRSKEQTSYFRPQHTEDVY